MINSSTLISIYDAAIDDSQWGPALDACSTETDARGVMLYEFPSVTEVNYRLEATSSYFAGIADVLREYNELVANGEGSGFDQEGLGKVHTTDVCSVLLDEEVWNMDGEFLKRPEMVLNLRAGFFRRALVNLSNDPNSLRGLIFLYGREYDLGLPSGLKGFGSAIAPHFVQAIELNRFTHKLRQRYQAVLSVLDKVTAGIFVLSADGDIIVANLAAQQVSDADEGVAITRSAQLAFRNADTTSEFRAKVRKISKTAQGENDEANFTLEIPRQSSAAPIVALISPLRDSNMEIEKGLSGALMTLIDPAREIDVELESVVLAYKLTTSEARTAKEVIKGLSNVEIAERFDRSPETIKSHLKSIFRKCGCSNRIEFLWRVFQLSPPIV